MSNEKQDGEAVKAESGKAAKKSVNKQIQSQYSVHATVMQKNVRIGDSNLAAAVFKQWSGIHHSLHYITDFARRGLKGRVVATANRGVHAYIADCMEQANSMWNWASDMAEQNAIAPGKQGKWKEQVLELSCRAESDVLAMVKVLDDYIIVMDSLWIENIIDDRRRDDAHVEVCKMINTLNKLLTKMRQKLIDFRKRKLGGSLGKSEEALAWDLENLVFDVTGCDIRKQREAEEAARAAARAAAKAANVAPNKEEEAKASDDGADEEFSEDARALAA